MQAERGHVAYKKETTWGTVAEPATKVWTMTNEGIIQNIEEILSKASRGILDEPHSYQGLKTFGGPVGVEVHPDNFGDILRSAISAPVSNWAAASIVVLETCETAWVADTGCIAILDNNDYKTGSGSAKIYIPAGIAAGANIATKDFVAVDMTADDQIKLWIKCSVNTALGDFKFLLDEQAACAVPDILVDIDALTAGVWKEVTLTLPDMSAEDAVISIGIEMDVDKGECILWIDDIRRIDTASAAAATAHDHVFTPSQEDFADADTVKRCPLYPYTIEVHKDQAADEAFQFTGAIVNTLNIKFGTEDKIVNAVAGILAQNVNRITKTANAFPTTNPYVWAQAVISFGAGYVTNNYLENVEINIDNKIIGVPSLNNSYVIRKFYRSAPRTVNINFVTDFVDQTEYDIFVAGTEQKMRIIFTGAAIVGDLTFFNTFTLYFPKFRYITYPITNPGKGRLTVAVTGKAKYCPTEEFSHQFTLRNCTASY